jgi:glycosyltransferase involved in cell wall biosynthesis
VIVLCYNQAAYVVDTLDSVRLQTYGHVQLIVTDDCSTDESAAVIRDWIDRHQISCHFLAHSKNAGICRTLNEALAVADGKYIAMVAADDIWLPEKLARQVEVLERCSDRVALVYTDAWRADVNGTRLPGMFIAQHRTFARMPEGDVLATLVDGNFIPALTPLIRRSALDQAGPYDEELAFEDWDMWLRLAASFEFRFLSWPSGVYRVVPNSLTHQLFRGPIERRRQRDRFRIYENCLRTPRGATEFRHSLIAKLALVAEQSYAAGFVEATGMLWRLLRAARSARVGLMFLFSAVRLPYDAFKRIETLHGTWIART